MAPSYLFYFSPMFICNSWACRTNFNRLGFKLFSKQVCAQNLPGNVPDIEMAGWEFFELKIGAETILTKEIVGNDCSRGEIA